MPPDRIRTSRNQLAQVRTVMTERQNTNLWTLTLNAVSIAIVAALATQVFHESCHAIAAVLAGARLKWFNLFGVSYVWVGEIAGGDA